MNSKNACVICGLKLSLRMYCIDTEALVWPTALLFIRFSQGYACYASPTDHKSNERHIHHRFLAPKDYLYSTSFKLRMTNNCIYNLNIFLHAQAQKMSAKVHSSPKEVHIDQP